MRVMSTKHFDKHLKKCPANIQKRFVAVYDNMVMVKALSELQNAEKLTGFENFYRIRIGSYRLGFYSVNNKIELLALLHRKEIYRFFP